ncbi:MAG: Gfo/Idh/MocA family protein [Caldicoprobacterales bacterium]|nr:Gfo/Idh/MocA family oxidoreductase [Clostridiales bacterium]
MKKIKVGIIGTGNISHTHTAGYMALDNVELYAACDINEQRVKDYARKYGYKHVFTDYNEMLKLEELDAVSVCTWNSVHAPASIAALKAGKHVLCEKPMAMNTEEALAMEKAAKEAGKLLMIGFVRRFGNDARILKDFIDSGMMGDIYYAKASYLRRNGCPGGWFGDKSRSGGGPLIDLGVHVIDLVRYMMGKPKPVSVTGATFNKLGDRRNIKSTKEYRASDDSEEIFDVEDLALGMIKFDNGSVLTVETSFSLNIEKNVADIELFGTRSGAKLSPELKFYSEINDYLVDVTPAHDTALSFTGLFENEIAHFIDCIANGTECISPAEDGVEIMKILDAVYESARTGREVVL